MKYSVSLQEKMTEKTEDIMHMVSKLKTIVKTGEETSKQINKNIQSLFEQYGKGKKASDVIMKEFNKLGCAVTNLTVFNVLITKHYTNKIMKSKLVRHESADSFSNLQRKEQLKKKLTLMCKEEEKLMHEIELCMKFLKDYKK